MTQVLATTSLLNGLSYGLMLFMLSAGLTLIFSLMGVLNFAHASFYMLGAYLGHSIARVAGFWPALVVAPLAVALLGAAFERHALRRVRRHGHVPELLVTFGLAYVVLELVQLVWGRAAVEFHPPEILRGPVLTLIGAPDAAVRLVWGAAPAALCQAASGAVCSPFPATRGFMMLVALAMLAALWLAWTRTRVGLVVQAALTHPQTVEALGHDVPRVLMAVFGAGAGLAALAGVVGGSTFVTEPSMAGALGTVIFVVAVVGGLGSLTGAFVASLLIGVAQTVFVAFDVSLHDLIAALGVPLAADLAPSLLRLTLAQVAPVLPYLLLVAMLIARPQGLMGRRA